MVRAHNEHKAIHRNISDKLCTSQFLHLHTKTVYSKVYIKPIRIYLYFICLLRFIVSLLYFFQILNRITIYYRPTLGAPLFFTVETPKNSGAQSGTAL